jgi:hypothetical protein
LCHQSNSNKEKPTSLLSVTEPKQGSKEDKNNDPSIRTGITDETIREADVEKQIQN